MNDDPLLNRVVVFTFCAVVFAVFSTLLYGLFDNRVDNKDIFQMMTHDFDMMLVALIGYGKGRQDEKGKP